MKLETEANAPKFHAKNEADNDISLDDFKGRTLILYFYPKDMTKGCSIEANDFSNLIDEFSALNAVIVGVSPDSTQSHQKFIKKENLKIMLLSDSDNKIASSYGAYGTKKLYGKEYVGIIRSTFIIKNGKILKAFYNVKATNHAQKVLETLKDLSK